MKSINVLGNTYKVKFVQNHSFMENEENTGECNFSDKIIRVAKTSYDIENSEEWQQETLLHEIAHAFLYESGQSDLNDERHAELLGKFASFILKKI